MKGMTAESIAQAAGGTLYMSVLTGDGNVLLYAPGKLADDGNLIINDSEKLADDGNHIINDSEKLADDGKEPGLVYESLSRAEIMSVVTDSRKADSGSLFIAIKGERVDGHSFIANVFDQGALCVISEKDLTGDELFSPAAKAGSKRPLYRLWIRTDNSVKAFGAAAALYLNLLNIPVLGVTGSVGKTSTKEMIASVLGRKYKTLKTEGNFNNELGLPISIFRLTEADEMAVLEMGISDFGEMHRLAAIARPDSCVITNIGICHLENLHDRDGVLRAKTEIFDHLKEGGRALLSGNDDKLRSIDKVNGQDVIFFGVDSSEEGIEDILPGEKVEFPGNLENYVCARKIRSMGFEGSCCEISCPMGSFEVRVPAPGIHNVFNAAAAAAAGLLYGLSFDEIREGIARSEAVSGRFRVLHAHGMTVIDDCYNANPVSMKASLKVLSGCQGSRRLAVLGDMGELGVDEEKLHREVGSYAALCADKLIAIGKLGRQIYEAARLSAEDDRLELSYYETVEEFLSSFSDEVKEGDTILVKASHFMNFPRIIKAMTD